MLDLLRNNMEMRKLTNVETVLGSLDDPKLPPGSMDLVLLVDVYHEFSEPQRMLRHIRDSLKPDGRMVLLEYRAEDLLGDKAHGGRTSLTRPSGARHDFGRPMLHALSLSLRHPRGGELRVEAALPPDFSAALAFLRGEEPPSL